MTANGERRITRPDILRSYNLDERHKIFLKLLKGGHLQATRLVNRQNLGVSRIFRALLEEGKEPPAFDETGQTVRVTFPGQKVDQAFKALLSFLTDKQGAYLDVDDLLLLHFFRRRHEVHWNDIREAYPYDDRRLREKLASLETRLLMLEHSGTGRGAIYRLSRRAAAILSSNLRISSAVTLTQPRIRVACKSPSSRSR